MSAGQSGSVSADVLRSVELQLATELGNHRISPSAGTCSCGWSTDAHVAGRLTAFLGHLAHTQARLLARLRLLRGQDSDR